MHADTPAMIWTRKYFLDENLEKWRGPSSTLPMVLNRDLSTIGKKCLTEAHMLMPVPKELLKPEGKK